MLGAVLTITVAALLFMSHSVGNARARTLISKLFKCCRRKATQPTQAELYGGQPTDNTNVTSITAPVETKL
jgi:hypothetical protein